MSVICEDVPGVCEDVPGVCEDVPAVCEDVATVCEEVQGVCEDVPGVCEDVPGVCEDVPAVCEDVATVCEDVPVFPIRGIWFIWLLVDGMQWVVSWDLTLGSVEFVFICFDAFLFKYLPHLLHSY